MLLATNMTSDKLLVLISLVFILMVCFMYAVRVLHQTKKRPQVSPSIFTHSVSPESLRTHCGRFFHSKALSNLMRETKGRCEQFCESVWYCWESMLICQWASGQQGLEGFTVYCWAFSMDLRTRIITAELYSTQSPSGLPCQEKGQGNCSSMIAIQQKPRLLEFLQLLDQFLVSRC